MITGSLIDVIQESVSKGQYSANSIKQLHKEYMQLVDACFKKYGTMLKQYPNTITTSFSKDAKGPDGIDLGEKLYHIENNIENGTGNTVHMTINGAAIAKIYDDNSSRALKVLQNVINKVFTIGAAIIKKNGLKKR